MSWLFHPLIHMSQQLAFFLGLINGAILVYIWLPYLYERKRKRDMRKLLQERDEIQKLMDLELRPMRSKDG